MEYIKPSFFIIGERKCGTSSLYRYLLAHPGVLPCKLKEPNFFGKGIEYVNQHINAYWSLFPKINDQEGITFEWPELNKTGILYHETVKIERFPGKQYISGEASANTFYDVSPQLIKKHIPDIRLIVLFRDPVERAFSHHRMFQRFQEEGRNLGFEILDFETDALNEMERIQNGESGAYLSPGMYIQQLKPWVEQFGWQQIRLYFAEDLSEPSKAKQIMGSIEQHLGLPTFDFSKFLEKRFNVAPPADISKSFKMELKAFFKPYNEALADFLNQPLPWS